MTKPYNESLAKLKTQLRLKIASKDKYYSDLRGCGSITISDESSGGRRRASRGAVFIPD
jgi:hypothetical protein